MNGIILAVLGGVALVALVLLWKRKASQRQPEVTTGADQQPESLPPFAAAEETPPEEGPSADSDAIPEPPEADEVEVVELVEVEEVSAAPEAAGTEAEPAEAV